MRDYRHNLMGQEHLPGKLAADRSVPVRPQLWRENTGELFEIVTAGKHVFSGERFVVYRKYEPNGEVFIHPLDEFMAGEPGDYRFTREF